MRESLTGVASNIDRRPAQSIGDIRAKESVAERKETPVEQAVRNLNGAIGYNSELLSQLESKLRPALANLSIGVDDSAKDVPSPDSELVRELNSILQRIHRNNDHINHLINTCQI